MGNIFPSSHRDYLFFFPSRLSQSVEKILLFSVPCTFLIPHVLILPWHHWVLKGLILFLIYFSQHIPEITIIIFSFYKWENMPRQVTYLLYVAENCKHEHVIHVAGGKHAPLSNPRAATPPPLSFPLNTCPSFCSSFYFQYDFPPFGGQRQRQQCCSLGT